MLMLRIALSRARVGIARVFVRSGAAVQRLGCRIMVLELARWRRPTLLARLRSRVHVCEGLARKVYASCIHLWQARPSGRPTLGPNVTQLSAVGPDTTRGTFTVVFQGHPRDIDGNPFKLGLETRWGIVETIGYGNAFESADCFREALEEIARGHRHHKAADTAQAALDAEDAAMRDIIKAMRAGRS